MKSGIKFDKKFWSTTFTLTGTIIGAGILGLPHVIGQTGVMIGLIWLVILGAIVIYVNLLLGEVTLRTKDFHQTPGYAKLYLGKWGEKVVFFAAVFGIYSALLAYLIGEGQSLSQLFFGNVNHAFYFAIGFWLMMTLLLHEGLKGLKKIETWGVIAIIIVIFAMIIMFFGKIDPVNFKYSDFSQFFMPFGVLLFSLMGFSSIPELRMEIKGSEKKLKKAIVLGATIPIILYLLFVGIVIGVHGKNISEVATLSFGNIMVLLGFFTMLTSYFVLSFSLKDIYDFDLHMQHYDFLLVSVFPLVLYMILFLLDKLDFSTVLGIGGVISGGLMGISILLMNLSAKKNGKRKPEYSVPIGISIIVLISLIFILGIITQVFFSG